MSPPDEDDWGEIGPDGDLWYPKDVAALKAAIPPLQLLTDFQVHELYSAFSNRPGCCASWLTLSEYSVSGFREYIAEHGTDFAGWPEWDRP
jgi:hypothetical protein